MEADQCDPDDVVEIADLLRSAETAFRAALDSAIEACMPTGMRAFMRVLWHWWCCAVV